MDRTIHTLLTVGVCTLLSSCASLSIKNVSFEWPVESVLTVDESNLVVERQRSVSFSVAALALEEFQDSTALKGKTIRLIRNTDGFYFVTATRFKNVYVLQSSERELSLHTRIAVSETGLSDPAFNRRTPYVELLDGPAFTRLLTSKNVVEGQKP
jgi:hypothetical protein